MSENFTLVVTGFPVSPSAALRADLGSPGMTIQIRENLSLSAFPITLTEESAMAAAPTIGESRMPNAG
jgi:hypothetical protein